MSDPMTARLLADYHNRLANFFLSKFRNDEIRSGDVTDQLFLRSIYHERLATIRLCAALILDNKTQSLFDSLICQLSTEVALAERQHDYELDTYYKRR